MSLSLASIVKAPIRAITNTTDSVVKTAAGIPKAVSQLPQQISSIANSSATAALDPDLVRFSRLGKSFQNTKPPRDVIMIGSPGKTGKAFELSAKTLKARYPNAETIYAFGDGLKGEEAHKSVMKRLKAAPIRNFVYTGHASESGLWIAPQTALGVKDFKDVKFEKAVIYGCNAGDRGGFGENLANQNRSTVRAIEGTMQFSGTENGYANYGFKTTSGASMDINKTPLQSDYPGAVWGVPAHPWATGDEWVEYPSASPQPSPGPSPRP